MATCQDVIVCRDPSRAAAVLVDGIVVITLDYNIITIGTEAYNKNYCSLYYYYYYFGF